MPLFTDQVGRRIILDHQPKNIVSLVPSQTELLYDLGLTDKVSGITKFCVRPHNWFHNKTRIGGTKSVKMDIIKRLKPDLIIANKEENVKAQVDELTMNYPVWISDINTLIDAMQMILAIGEITGTADKSKEINDGIQHNFSSMRAMASMRRTAYLIWRNPYMTVGGDTFINAMLKCCGFYNLFENQLRYPVVTIEQLRIANCELLLLSSEPFPFKEKHIAELQNQLPGTRILLADGEMFSWYGSRLLFAPAYFASLIQQAQA